MSQSSAQFARVPLEPETGERALDESLIGRRSATRHPLDIAGRFVSGPVNVRVQLEDISASGAAFRLMHPRLLRSGLLGWLGFETFGEIVWQREARCGLRFADRLPVNALRETLEFADEVTRDEDGRLKRLASAWAFGPGDY